MANVIFKVGTRAQFEALLEKNVNTLYWLTDTQELYKGDILYGVGREATNLASGLMSAADKAKLDSLVSGNLNFTPVDGSVIIKTNEDGSSSIGVGLSEKEGNILSVEKDGLFASFDNAVVPEYSVEKQVDAENGFGATYKLKRTAGQDVSYVGAAINIPKDLVVQSGSLQVVSAAGEPYADAQVGDPYIDLVLNDTSGSHIYIPVRGLVDTYTAGMGIEIVDGSVGVKLSAVEANGLFLGEDGLGLNLATPTSAGALSAVDKAFIDSIPEVFASKEEVNGIAKMVEYEVAHKPDGTIVDYRDKEIRVMCPADTQWSLQNSGENANKNMYYIGFRAYAPEGAVSFKEDLAEIISDTTMYYFENNEFAGTDQFGRKYSVVWLPVASYDEATSAWTYYGNSSSEDRFIGWHYSVEWYDANGKKFDADTIRINLSNEGCHNKVEPYYVASLAAQIGAMEESYTWGSI